MATMADHLQKGILNKTRCATGREKVKIGIRERISKIFIDSPVAQW